MIFFSVLGCKFRITFSCFALLAFCCLFAGIGSGAFFLLAAAMHEGAHIITLFAFHARVSSVTLSAMGCRVELAFYSRLSRSKSAAVSLAGPFINLLSFGLCSLFLNQSHPFLYASVALGVLHILPIEPLDGGLALRSFLSAILNANAAAKISFAVSMILLLPLSVLGFLVLLYTRNNFSLLALSIYLMLYILLKRDFTFV